MRGTVKVWFEDRSYGFIAGDDGTDYFVHWREIVSSERRKSLVEGERATFDPAKSDKGTGWKAVGVMADRERDKK